MHYYYYLLLLLMCWYLSLYFVDSFIPSESEMIKMTGTLPVFVQQAAAAKAIRCVIFVRYNYRCN